MAMTAIDTAAVIEFSHPRAKYSATESKSTVLQEATGNGIQAHPASSSNPLPYELDLQSSDADAGNPQREVTPKLTITPMTPTTSMSAETLRVRDFSRGEVIGTPYFVFPSVPCHCTCSDRVID